MSDRPIDFDHLAQYTLGDSALRDEILSIFADQLDSLVGQFSIQQSDDEWRALAHTLKGAARGVGAWALGDACAQAEKITGAAAAKEEARASILVLIRHHAGLALNEAASVREQTVENLSSVASA